MATVKQSASDNGTTPGQSRRRSRQSRRGPWFRTRTDRDPWTDFEK
jgi:hypothetical protein